jgi:serine/threonine-protein kinase GIN4
MTKGVEKMLRRMIAPNADLRCTATEAMADGYWHSRKEADTLHSLPTLSTRLDIY